MNQTLFKKEIKHNFKIWLLFCAVLTLYTAMIISMFDPKLGKSLEMMRESMPEIFAAVGMSAPGETLLDFMINYLFGFLYKVFPMVFFILMINRVFIRYLDRGTMAYLLSTSNSRKKIAITQIATILILLGALLIYVAMLAIGVSESLFSGELDIVKFLLVIIGLFGLLFFLSGISYFSGCMFQDSGKAIGVGTGLNILFILIQMISQVGEKFEFLKYFTPLTLFMPEKIAEGKTEGIYLFVILYLGGVLLYSMGVAVFNKKDLSL